VQKAYPGRIFLPPFVYLWIRIKRKKLKGVKKGKEGRGKINISGVVRQNR
jgi:hypothetical protein